MNSTKTGGMVFCVFLTWQNLRLKPPCEYIGLSEKHELNVRSYNVWGTQRAMDIKEENIV